MALLDIDEREGVLIAKFQGGRIIDESHIESLGKELVDLLNLDKKKMVLNFVNVNFMSSAMIGKLIQFAKKCSTSNVDLRFCDVNENIGEVFQLMKLDSMFTVETDEETAIKNANKKGWFS